MEQQEHGWLCIWKRRRCKAEGILEPLPDRRGHTRKYHTALTTTTMPPTNPLACPGTPKLPNLRAILSCVVPSITSTNYGLLIVRVNMSVRKNCNLHNTLQCAQHRTEKCLKWEGQTNSFMQVIATGPYLGEHPGLHRLATALANSPRSGLL